MSRAVPTGLLYGKSFRILFNLQDLGKGFHGCIKVITFKHSFVKVGGRVECRSCEHASKFLMYMVIVNGSLGVERRCKSSLNSMQVLIFGW
jgi:hypothetical protein